MIPENPDRVLLVGDLHGNTVRAREAVHHAANIGINTIVQLGDFGFWTPGWKTNRYLDGVEKVCSDKGVTFLWVSGNHEDYSEIGLLWTDPETGLQPIRPNIFHLPRGHRWTWHGRTWMALGGAHSVDSHMRIEGKSWWPEEHLSDEDVAKAIEGGPVDVIVAHDCPDGVDIPGLAPLGTFPPEQIHLSALHRLKVGEVVDATKPKVLFHGHYHCRYAARRGETQIIGLADDVESLRDNVMIVNLNGAALVE